MPVYLPTAVTGNSRLLVTLGSSAEIMGLFYPWIDFPQNVYECMTACHFPGVHPHFCWTFERCWTRTQSYADDCSPCVRTQLTHSNPPLTLIITDLVLPDEEAFLRQFEVRPPGAEGTLYQYFDFALGEVQQKDSVRYLREEAAIVQYWRDLCFVTGGDAPDQFQCGQSGKASSARQDMIDGRLQGNIQDIGDVNFALGWHLKPSPRQVQGAPSIRPSLGGPGTASQSDGEPVEPPAAEGETESSLCRRFFISCGRSEEEARARLLRIRPTPTNELLLASSQRWNARSTPTPHFEPEDAPLPSIYRRAVSMLYLLRDARGGAFLAAPEFDPNFERSGGYGYCWPRDACEAVLTLLKLGDLAPVGEFFSWCRSAQAKEGHWNQRYWLWAKLGPAWCLFEDFNQIDQTASVLFAFSAWWRLLDAGQKAKAWKRFRNMVSRAADFLVKATQPSGLHRQASDLWETFRGSFTYSNAAISASLKSLGQVAEEMDAPRLAERWANAAALTRQAILERLWTGSTFVRGIVDGRLDTTPDASVLGLVDPFQVLDLANEDDRKKAESLVKSLQTSLTVQLPGGPALKRFAGDTYLEGAASAVSTLALARVLLLLAAESSKLETRGSKEPQAGHAGINPQDAIQSALAYIRTVIHNTTQTGLLPEMICPPPQTPYWAAPHLWASASLIMACFYLEEARAAAGTTAP